MLRQLALRVILPMAAVTLLLFGLLAWEALQTHPDGGAGLVSALLRNGGLLLLGLALVTASGWMVAARALGPIAELTEAIERIGHGEQVRLQIDRGEILGRLQRGVNEASQALARSRNRMESELGRTTVELADKNAKLEAASLSRARFLAAASHDLRQPLYALTLFSSALRAGETDPAKLTRVLHIEECVASLDHLFSELLDLSRLETGAVHAAMSDVRLDEVFDEVSRNFRMLAESRGLRLIVRKTDAWVRADRTMLTRIL
ncbi:MAG TPA: HAMP domain-containing sensor histidine kinase, partial [Thermomonas sp.]|nr:HAMP domain-containing sensor histidine kinase [Thermomonas sp.]